MTKTGSRRMITCEKCQKKFLANYQQGYPGHCDPPSSLIAYAVLFTVIAIVCGIAGIFVIRTVMFLIGFVLIHL